MQEAIPRWPASLNDRPRITQTAVAIHGQTPVERYNLPGQWCIHLYRYEGTLTVNGQDLAIRPGRLSVLPPDTDLTYRYAQSRCPHIYAHFQLAGAASPAVNEPRPSGSGCRTNAGGFPLPYGRGSSRNPLSKHALRELPPTQHIPAIRDLGADLPGVDDAMSLISRCFLTQPLRAEVKLWDLLLRLADDASAEAQPRAQSHPAFRQAVQIVERELAEPLTVAELARRVGLSHNQLTRIFRAAAGATPIAYLRRRRALRAQDLLRRSTLPLKVIAASVGLGDPHQFNKVIRRELRASPRAVRAMGGG